MTPAAVCHRVTLTLEISGVLFSALQVAAAMAGRTVPDFMAKVLRESQVTFFAEDGEDLAVEVLAVRDVDPSPSPPVKRETAGALQRAILGRIDGAGVCDLQAVRKALHNEYQPAIVSREVHRLIERGQLVPMMPSRTGFSPGGGGQVRFVARGARI